MKKLLLLFLVLLLISSCTPEGDIDSGVGSSDSEDSDSGVIGDTDDEEVIEEVFGFSVDDFLGADNIVGYTGSISESDQIMESSISEYWDYEEDSLKTEEYTFSAVRVYFGDMSVFYLADLTGLHSWTYTEMQEEISSEETTITTITDSGGVAGQPDGNVKIGQVDADGEIYISVYGFYVGDHTSQAIKTITYSDGQTQTSEVNNDFQILSFGGGSTEPCEGDSSDRSLVGPSICKIYLERDGSSSGTFTDLIYTDDEDGSETMIKTTTWSLTPIDEIEEPFYTLG